MKKIINGRKYDTEKATMLGEWSNMSDYRDFNYFCETLYRKRNGEYFLCGEGNAASKYAESMGQNSWSGGWAIMPLSYESAQQWAVDHLEVDEYEAIFGEVSEDDDEEVVLSVRVPSSAKAALDRLAAKTGRSKGDLVTEAILALK